MLQIKGTFYRTYTDAVLNYNAEDEASHAVDNLQHRVSLHEEVSWTPPCLAHAMLMNGSLFFHSLFCALPYFLDFPYFEISHFLLFNTGFASHFTGWNLFLCKCFKSQLSLKVNGIFFHLQLRCCGVYNYTSWFGSVYYPSNGLPASCCLNSSDCNQEDLRNATVAPSKVYHQVRWAFSSLCFWNPFLPSAPLTPASAPCRHTNLWPLWFRAATSWSLLSWRLTWLLSREWRSGLLSHR